MHQHLSLRSKLIVMISVMASLFLVALDQTIVSTALGRIVEEFHAFDSLSWIVTAYLLTTTVTVPIAGKLSDLYGRRTLLLIGVAVFGLGSYFSATSGNVDHLIFARAFQGIGGGIITANAFTIVGDLFAARERGKWQGLIGAVFGLSSLIGPLLGGWLTDNHQLLGMTTDWRWTFYINVPVAITAFVLIMLFCPALRRERKPSVDYIGAALLTVSLATLVLAVDNTEQIFSSILSSTGMSLLTLRIILFTIVAISVIGFAVSQRRAKEPILPPHFFKSRNYIIIILIATFFGASFMGSILYLTQFNQQVFGASPTTSGLMLLPMVGGMMITSVLAGQIISRTGKYKIFMQIGLLCGSIMLLLLSSLTAETEYWMEAIIISLLGMSLGMIMPVMSIAVQSEFTQVDLGAATSSSQLFRSLGSTIGIALFGALLTSGLAVNLRSVDSDPYLISLKDSPLSSQVGDMNNPNTQLVINMPDTKKQIQAGFEQSISRLPGSVKAKAEQDFSKNQSEYSKRVATAFGESIQPLFRIAALSMFIAFLISLGLTERKLAKASPRVTPGEA